MNGGECYAAVVSLHDQLNELQNTLDALVFVAYGAFIWWLWAH